MPKTLFRPQIDGSGFEFIDEIDKKEIAAVRRKFKSAIKPAINFLKHLYSAAIEIYDIRNSLADSVANEIPPDFILNSGKIYFTLDYYYARRFFPKSVSKNEKKSILINAFFQSRISDSIKSNAALLLGNTAIAYMIPDRWLPESWLIDPIKEELKKMEIVKDSSIDLTLNLPSGGNLWLSEKCREEWDKLKNHIDSGRPWPIKLIGESLNPYENESVIAYGYKAPGDGTGAIYVHNPRSPKQGEVLNFKFHGHNQITVESYDSQPDSNIRGFYCENYSPGPPPVIGRLLFLRKMLPLKLVWYLTRWVRLFSLWIRSLIPN
jgi:hypothetical protein